MTRTTVQFTDNGHSAAAATQKPAACVTSIVARHTCPQYKFRLFPQGVLQGPSRDTRPDVCQVLSGLNRQNPAMQLSLFAS